MQDLLFLFFVFDICILQSFHESPFRTNASHEENMAEIKNDAIAYVIAALIEAVIQLLAGAICVDCFNRAAIFQVTRMRVKYFKSLMRQDIGWYDLEKSKSNFTVRLTEYVIYICVN